MWYLFVIVAAAVIGCSASRPTASITIFLSLAAIHLTTTLMIWKFRFYLSLLFCFPELKRGTKPEILLKSGLPMSGFTLFYFICCFHIILRQIFNKFPLISKNKLVFYDRKVFLSHLYFHCQFWIFVRSCFLEFLRCAFVSLISSSLNSFEIASVNGIDINSKIEN